MAKTRILVMEYDDPGYGESVAQSLASNPKLKKGERDTRPVWNVEGYSIGDRYQIRVELNSGLIGYLYGKAMTEIMNTKRRAGFEEHMLACYLA